MVKKLDKFDAQQKMNELAQNGIPFLFIIDFDFEQCQVYALDEIPQKIRYCISNNSDSCIANPFTKKAKFNAISSDFKKYREAFYQVKKEIDYGNSFLLNLSASSQIITDYSLQEIFDSSHAKYKLLIEDELLVFSPESFVQIENGSISSFPMKGTIDARIENAESIILSNAKEKAEHFTIVDLIRNDLSMVAKNVRVEKFRYIDRIQSNQKDLLQVSSKIRGNLDSNYQSQIGDIMFKLLPAGSVTGAPKKKTVDIINKVEEKKRRYYTGIFGVFDGSNLDSGVMIRCIQKEGDNLFYHSGGGITHMSNLEEEYQEIIDKVYVPIIRNNTNTEWKGSTTELPQSAV